MKTLAAALVMIAAGRSRTLSLRLKVLELLQSDTTRNRAQFLELLEPVGPALLETGEAVLASKEWAGDLGMRKLQAGKGQGSHNKRDFQKTGEKTDTKGGKDGGKKEKHGKGKKGAPHVVSLLRSEAKQLPTHSPKPASTTPCFLQVVPHTVPSSRPITGHLGGSGMLRQLSVRRLHMHLAVIKQHLLLKPCSLLVSALPSQACPQTGTPAADTGLMRPGEGPRTNG